MSTARKSERHLHLHPQCQHQWRRQRQQNLLPWHLATATHMAMRSRTGTGMRTPQLLLPMLQMQRRQIRHAQTELKP